MSLSSTLSGIKPLNQKWTLKAKEHHAQLLMPTGALDGILWIVEQLAAIQETFPVKLLKHPAMVLFAADHGVAASGVSAYPPEVTAQMVGSFANNWAVSTVLARHNAMSFQCIDVGVRGEPILHPQIVNKKIAQGTKNFLEERAMTPEQAVKSIEIGLEMAKNLKLEHKDLAIIGEMGIGNTTSASAITAAILEKPVTTVTGRGTGVDEKTFHRKTTVIQTALIKHHPKSKNSLDVLESVGGFEIGAMAGFLLGCAKGRVPVILDGFITGAAALLAYQLKAEAKDYWFSGTASQEPGHQYILEYLNLKPLLQLSLRLGEGSAAALSFPLFNEAITISSNTATFAQAQVSDKDA